MDLRNGTSIVLTVLKVLTILSMVTYYIRKTNVKSVALCRKIGVNLISYTKMVTRRTKIKLI